MRILIVDDEEVMRKLMGWIVREQEAEIHTARSCSEAREKIKSIRFDLVLLDNGLPDGMGLSMIREIRDSGAKVIMVTADAHDERFVKTALGRGASAVVAKPFAPSLLEEAIRNATAEGKS